jgi:hypothetical protein
MCREESLLCRAVTSSVIRRTEDWLRDWYDCLLRRSFLPWPHIGSALSPPHSNTETKSILEINEGIKVKSIKVAIKVKVTCERDQKAKI